MKAATRVLLIDPSVEVAGFIEDALLEATEIGYTPLRFDLLHLEEAEDALFLLEAERFDCVLLGLSSVNRDALELLVKLRRTAPLAAVVAILDADERSAGRLVLRQGAQDYLVAGEFDYAPLARAVENALERQRTASALEAVAMNDPATGAFSLRAFELIGRRDLALRSDRAWSLLLAEVAPGDPEQADLLLMDAASALKCVFGEEALVGRIGPCRLAVLSPWTAREQCETRVRAALPAGAPLQFGWAPVRDGETSLEAVMLEAAAGIPPAGMRESRSALPEEWPLARAASGD